MNLEYVLERYRVSPEERRSTTYPFFKTELRTTEHYIEKFLPKDKKYKILEVGAGTGYFTIPLAKRGYDVTALELVERNVKIMKKNARGLRNHLSLVGDGLDLSRFADETFDMVLNLGPLYHLFSDEECQRAVDESLRVCKPNGVCMFAFVTHSYVFNVFMCLLGKLNELGNPVGNLEGLAHLINKDGTITPSAKDIPFRGHTVTQIRDYFNNLAVEELHMLTSDGLSVVQGDLIGKMNPAEFDIYLKRHLAVCENPEMLGYGGHMLCIVKKRSA